MMFRRVKVFFLIALVIGVFSLVFFLFYSTTYYGKTTQYFAILKTNFSNQGSQHIVENKLREYVLKLRKNITFTGGTVHPSVKDSVKVLSTPNSKSEENPSSASNGGDKVDQLIQKSLEKSKPELHSEGDEPIDSKDDPTTPTTPIDELNSEQETEGPAAPSAVSKQPSNDPSDEEDEDLELCPEKPKSLSKYKQITMSDFLRTSKNSYFKVPRQDKILWLLI